MLIEFTVKNYASFKDETTLSAETGSRLRKLKETNTFSYKHPALLKSLLLFGPNGSGKSQLINALARMRTIVTRPTQTVTDTLIYNPFMFNEDSRKKDTVFKVKIELKNIIYIYSFAYNFKEVTQESLIRYKNNKKTLRETFSEMDKIGRSTREIFEDMDKKGRSVREIFKDMTEKKKIIIIKTAPKI